MSTPRIETRPTRDMAPEELPPMGGLTQRAERDPLYALIAGWVQHDSWRCEHPPHYYLAGGPPENGDCACGLLSALKAAGIDPERWRP